MIVKSKKEMINIFNEMINILKEIDSNYDFPEEVLSEIAPPWLYKVRDILKRAENNVVKEKKTDMKSFLKAIEHLFPCEND